VGPPCVPLALLISLDPRPLQVTQGDTEALCQSGLDHYAAGRKAKAAELYSLAVAQGHAEAQRLLGLMYRRGEGVPQNSKKAVDLISLAAAQGHAHAQYSLALMYRAGDWVPQNSKKAAELLSQAVAQGHTAAQFHLGVMYGKGDGMPQDTARGLALLQQAAAQGWEPAQEALAGITKPSAAAVEAAEPPFPDIS
jgi:TPR repeat protein